jgi:uncharacterized membrane protein
MEVGSPDPVAFVVALVTLVVLDACWFTIVRRFRLYPSDVFEGVRLAYGAGAWVALALALACLRRRHPWQPTAWGAAVGGITFAVFNSTELAIRPTWTRRAALLDTLWGVTACTLAGVVGHVVSCYL